MIKPTKPAVKALALIMIMMFFLNSVGLQAAQAAGTNYPVGQPSEVVSPDLPENGGGQLESALAGLEYFMDQPLEDVLPDSGENQTEQLESVAAGTNQLEDQALEGVSPELPENGMEQLESSDPVDINWVQDNAGEEPETEAEPLSVSLMSDESSGFLYSLLDGSFIKITGYTGSSATVTIPGVIDDYTVQAIGASAFEDRTDI
ncbi:MAG: hypothetical protein GX808_02360, partial [Syntrophomonadaceae bacterium]|nr:hypothetical protein [Syntrophomonadaceae bacterium]